MSRGALQLRQLRPAGSAEPRSRECLTRRLLVGGAAASLRSDNLGKTIGAQLLRMSIDVGDDAAAQVAIEGARRAIESF